MRHYASTTPRGTSRGGDAERRRQRVRLRRVADALRATYGVPLRNQEPPLNVLIRTVLSQHTSGVLCDRAFDRLRHAFRQWEDVERASVAAIAAAIRPVGLFRLKAARLRNLLRALRRRHGRLTLAWLGHMDTAAAMAALRALDGVGPKTAACVLLFGFGRDVFPVDTHIRRLCVRLGFVPPAATAEHTQSAMADLVPCGRSLELHINLIRHGSRVCTSQRPKCERCGLARDCPSR